MKRVFLLLLQAFVLAFVCACKKDITLPVIPPSSNFANPPTSLLNLAIG